MSLISDSAIHPPLTLDELDAQTALALAEQAQAIGAVLYDDQSLALELAKAGDWDESKHPRGKDGKFGEGGGGEKKPELEGSQLQPVGGQLGSNKGGVYQTENGDKYYVKFYKDPDQVHSEIAAQELYRSMGIATPQGQAVTIDGKTALANKWMEGTTSMSQQQMKDWAKDNPADAGKLFAASVATQNWDVIGLSYDNLVKMPDGKVGVVDTGGSYLFRAQGGPKPYTQDPKEIAGLTKASINPSAAAVFGPVQYNEQFRQGAQETFKSITDKAFNAAAGGTESFKLPPGVTAEQIIGKCGLAEKAMGGQVVVDGAKPVVSVVSKSPTESGGWKVGDKITYSDDKTVGQIKEITTTGGATVQFTNGQTISYDKEDLKQFSPAPKYQPKLDDDGVPLSSNDPEFYDDDDAQAMAEIGEVGDDGESYDDKEGGIVTNNTMLAAAVGESQQVSWETFKTLGPNIKSAMNIKWKEGVPNPGSPGSHAYKMYEIAKNGGTVAEVYKYALQNKLGAQAYIKKVAEKGIVTFHPQPGVKIPEEFNKPQPSAVPTGKANEDARAAFVKESWQKLDGSKAAGWNDLLGKKNLTDLKEHCTPHELKAIRDYSNGSYGQWNTHLGKGGELQAEHLPLVSALQHWPNRYKGDLVRSETLYPEVEQLAKQFLAASNQDKASFLFYNKTFWSTRKTKNRDTEKAGYRWHLKCKSGADISKLSHYPSEKEVLFQPRTKWKVTDVKTITNQYSPGKPQYEIWAEEV